MVIGTKNIIGSAQFLKQLKEELVPNKSQGQYNKSHFLEDCRSE